MRGLQRVSTRRTGDHSKYRAIRSTAAQAELWAVSAAIGSTGPTGAMSERSRVVGSCTGLPTAPELAPHFPPRTLPDRVKPVRQAQVSGARSRIFRIDGRCRV